MSVYDWHDPWAVLDATPEPPRYPLDLAAERILQALVKLYRLKRVEDAFARCGVQRLSHVPTAYQRDLICDIAAAAAARA